MTRRPTGGALIALAGLLLSGCTSASSPSHTARTSASVAPVVAPSSGGTLVAAGPIADRMQHALAGASSARVSITSTVAGETLTGGGALALRSGAVAAADVTDELPAKLGTIRLVRAAGTDYARLPTAFARRDTPWVVLDAHSSDIVTAQLAGIATPLLGVASPATLAAIVRSAPAVRDQGPTRVGTTSAHRYAVTVDRGHLPAGVPASIAGGAGPRVVEVSLDAAGRPVQVSGTLVVSGLAVAASVVLSDYGRPVSISAPPAGRIAR